MNQTIRSLAIVALGGKCVKCGWTGLEQVLQICPTGGDEDSRKHFSREAYYLHVYNNATSGRWELLCRNCKFARMYERQTTHRRMAPTFVWQTDMDPSELKGVSVGALDEQVRKGSDVLVVGTGGVWQYRPWEKVGESWGEVAEKRGLGNLPNEPMAFVDRRQ